MNDQAVIRVLQRLYKISKAAERGMRTSSENVTNRGLKLLLKHYAQERRDNAAALRAQLEKMNGSIGDRDEVMGLLGLIHRGRIAIVATMTLGKTNSENVVIKEALWGDAYAIRAYEKGLAQSLPTEIKALLQKQHDQLVSSRRLLERLRGGEGTRAVVRLFDSEGDMKRATEALQDAGYAVRDIEVEPVAQYISNPYQGKGTPVREAVLSGAVGGAVWGTLLGLAAGAAGFVSELVGVTYPVQTILGIFALTSMLSGTGIGAFLGLFIGAAIAEEDALLYEDGLENGALLAIMQTDRQHATAISKIMYAANLASRVQTQTQGTSA